MNTVGINQFTEGFETLVEFARELSSAKSPDELWRAVQDEWLELQEVVAKMQQQPDRIQRKKLLPFYLDELADVWWNLAKYEAFSPIPMNDVQQALLVSLQSMKDFGCDIMDRASRKFEERYGTLGGLATRAERDEQWGKIKQIQQSRLTQESVQVGIQTLLRLNTGKRNAEFGTLEDIRGNPAIEIVLVNKGLVEFVYRAVSMMVGISAEEVKECMRRKDYCILRCGTVVFLIQIIKGPESVQAILDSYPALPMTIIGGKDVIRKLEAIQEYSLDEIDEISGVPFWGTSEILCLVDKQSIDEMIRGKLPTWIYTRGTPLITKMATLKSTIQAKIISTDSNTEALSILSSCLRDDKSVCLSTEIVEKGSSILANDLYVLYWDESQKRVIVYSPCLRGENGRFPDDKIYASISVDENPQIVEFVRTFQTPLNVCVAQIQNAGENARRDSRYTNVLADMVKIIA